MRIHATVIVGLLLAGGSAEAATCSFDGTTGVLTVDLLGTKSELKANATGILLDGVACGAATKTSTSRIVVNGNGTAQDIFTLRGKFAPGRNDSPETDDPEIEIDLVNGWQESRDSLTVIGSVRADTWRVSASGINLNGDLDADVTVPPAGKVYLRTMDGDDAVDASAYTGSASFRIHGGDGNDTLTGGPQMDYVYGEAGNDHLFGGSGNDFLYDGLGADVMQGGPGDDGMYATDVADEADDFRGGAGSDTVSYQTRLVNLTVTIDNLADDGAAGENDNVHLDVENVFGGDGDDVLVGSDADNFIWGGYDAGYDEIYGGAGDDELWCILTDGCYASGDEGNDSFAGSSYDDVFDGGPGDDFMVAHNGNDTLIGGDGVDYMDGRNGDDIFYNADGFADTVLCDYGNDDAEPDPLDSFNECENI